MPDESNRQQVACKVCDRGFLASKKIFRMSGPVVVIGFIFLIPSVLGILPAALLLGTMILSKLLGIVINLSGFIETIVFTVGILSFIGGLLGWLLVMRKRVLQCSVCGATVNAS